MNKILVEYYSIKIMKELKKAIKKFKSFNSFHEGYAVIKEELDELWNEIKNKKQDKNKIKNECIQTAAMCLRMLYDFYDDQGNYK